MNRRRLQDSFSPFVRFVLAGNAVLTWYNTFTNSESTLAEVGSTDDGSVFIFVIGLCGAIMLADLLINDWTPDSIRVAGRRYHFRWKRTWKLRHWLFVAISACYAAQPQIADTSGQPIAVKILVYFWAGVYMAAAYIDAGDRSRRLWWQATSRA